MGRRRVDPATRDILTLLGVMVVPCVGQHVYTRSLVHGPTDKALVEAWFVANAKPIAMLVVLAASLWVLSAVLAVRVLRGSARVLALCWSATLFLIEAVYAGLGKTPESHGQVNLCVFVFCVLAMFGAWALGEAIWAARKRLSAAKFFAAFGLIAAAIWMHAYWTSAGWENGLNDNRMKLSTPGCTISKPWIEWDGFLLVVVKAVIHKWWALRPCERSEFARINATSGEFVMDCERGGRYTLYPFTNEKNEDLWQYVHSRLRVADYTGPVPRASWDNGNVSAIVAQCGGKKHIVLPPIRADPSLVRRAQETQKALAADTRPAWRKTSSTAPDVVVVYVDSVARASWYRNLPVTTRFLERLAKGNNDVVVTEYMKYHSFSMNTMRNSRAMFLGNEWLGARVHENIWQTYQRRGYVTMFVDNSCTEWARKYGRGSCPSDVNPNAIWCHEDYTGDKEDTIELFRGGSSIIRHCLGGRQVDEMVWEYVLSFLSAYEAVPKFAMMKMTEGHEVTNSLMSTVDDNLAKFLAKIDLNKTALFVLSDHGLHMGVGLAVGLYSAVLENKLPVMFSILPRWLASPYEENLKQNAQALVTPADVHGTLMDLAEGWPYPDAFEAERSLLSVRIPLTDGCRRVNITDAWCACT